MKLVFVTQVIDPDDAVLGFVARWVQGLAKHCERVRVVALEAGNVSELPDNVDVRVIGRRGTLRRWWRYRRSLAEAFGSHGFDALLTHMVPRYSILAAPIARRRGVGHFLWYTHKGVDGRLRKAVELVDAVFTASEESMRVETDKRVVTGHGIDVEHFSRSPAPSGGPRLLSVGRLSPAKDPLTVIDAVAKLRARGLEVVLDWAGPGLARGDDEYWEVVRERASQAGLEGVVTFHGAVSYREIPELYARSSLLVSASRTGSVDKVVLEAMASARPVVTCNESFAPIFGELGEEAERLAFPAGDSEALAARVLGLLARAPAEREALGERLRAIVVRDHEVDALTARLVERMTPVRS